MARLVADSRRNGRTGRLPSACRALAMPAKLVASLEGTQTVPAGA